MTTQESTTQAPAKRAGRRRLQGTVVSTKMQKTAVVRVDRRVRHPKYGKIYNVSRKYKVHDPEDRAVLGDVVEISEMRPLSTDKRWRYIRTVRTAA